MTYEEAQQLAIAAGALKPHGLMENMAANWSSSQNWSFNYGNTVRARGRLEAWTAAILNGVSPQDVKSQLG